MTTMSERPVSVAYAEETSAAPTSAPRRRRSRALLKPLLVTLDYVTLVTAFVIAYVIARLMHEASTPASLASAAAASDRKALALVLIVSPLWLVVFASSHLYTSRFVSRPLDELRRIANGCALGVVAIALASFVTKIDVPRSLAGLVFVLALGLVAVERSVVRLFFRRLRARGQLVRPVVVVGDNAEADAIAAMLATSPDLGYDVRSFVDSSARSNDRSAASATVRETLEAVQRTGATGVIIAATAVDHETSNRLIRVLTDQGVHVELSSTLVDVASNRLVVRPLGRMPVMYIEPVQRSGWRARAKRAQDVALASFGLLVTSPVLLVAAIAIKIDSRGPVLFKQQRVGRNGRLFKVLKLRTMVCDAETQLIDLRERNEADGPLFKMREDPRVTRVGRLLRKLSIDELPQLWNVLRNDMSMVGPRPALPAEMAAWGADLHGRLRVKPGITGMWQVSGRSNSSFQDYERLDLYYVDNWSLATDLAIIAKTLPMVLLRRGAF